MRRTIRVVGLLSLALLAACGQQKKEEQKDEAKVPVEIALAANGLIEAAYRGTATLEAEAEATVAAKTAGVIEKILVEEGEPVRAGQVLARLDTERLRYELARATASREQAEQNFQRNESVFQRNIVSREAYDKTKYELETTRAAYDVAALNLREAEIKAPIDGVISQRYIKAGNAITVGAQAFRITRLDRLQAAIYVPERDIHKLAPQQRATVWVDAWPEQRFGAQLLRISPVVDAQSGTVKVTLQMDAGQRQLKPGMFARVEILYDRREQALLVPRDAVLAEDAAQSLFVVSGNRAQRRSVHIGYSDAQHIEIMQGLKAGEQVVVTGQANLKDDAPVSVVNPQPVLPAAPTGAKAQKTP